MGTIFRATDHRYEAEAISPVSYDAEAFASPPWYVT